MSKVFAAIVVTLLATASPASAFDTAHHWEMTRNALMREGFNDESIRIVTLQNWLTDFYAAYDSTYLKPTIREGDRATVENAQWLHFDNLTTTKDVSQYWDTLVNSTAMQLYRVATSRKDDPLEILTILGVSLHAVQDFYTHSNWVADNGSTCKTDQFLAITWLDATRDRSIPTKRIHTGTYGPNSHGGADSHDQMNKDSIERDCWAEAYVLAYKATRQWVRAFGALVDKYDGTRDLWERCVRGPLVRGADSQTLTTGLDASRQLSLLTGKWQGGGMGGTNVGTLATTFYRFRDAVSTYKDAMVEGKVLAYFALKLRGPRPMVGPFPFAPPVFDPAPDDEHVFFLRVDQVTTTDLSSPSVLPHEENFFLNVTLTAETTDSTVYQQQFRTVTDFSNYGQRATPWRVVWFVPRTAAKVEARIEARNDGPSATVPTAPGASYEVAIYPNEPPKSLLFTYRFADLTCAIGLTGQPTSCNAVNRLTSEGKTIPRARIRFFVEKPTFRQGW